MSHTGRPEKRNWFLFMVGYFAAGYLVINWVASRRSVWFDLSTGLDRAIPFVPTFIFGYVIVYLSVIAAYIVIVNMDDWLRIVAGFLIATTVAYITFLAFPVKMVLRPEIGTPSGISEVITIFYYFIDLPYNCFPSLHVIYPILATLAAWRNHLFMRWIFAAVTVIVAVSVLLVKQHYIADVVAGFFVAGGSFWVAIKLEDKWSKFLSV